MDRLLPSGANSAPALETQLEHKRVDARTPQDADLIRRSWCFGEAEFQAGMLERVAQASGGNHHGEEIAAAAEVRAERLVAQALASLKWTEEDVRSKSKGDPQKLAVAEQLRAESTMSLAWIAARLCMGTPGHLSHLLYWKRRGVKPPKRVSRSQQPESVTADEIRIDTPTSSPSVPESSPFEFDPTFD
jgi:hypothetical protein